MRIRIKLLLKFLPAVIKNEDNQFIMKNEETMEDNPF